VLLAESELWPNIITEVARRGVPLVLVNARLSKRSFGRWRMFGRTAAALLSHIDLCLAQEAEDALHARQHRRALEFVQGQAGLRPDLEEPCRGQVCRVGQLAAQLSKA